MLGQHPPAEALTQRDGIGVGQRRAAALLALENVPDQAGRVGVGTEVVAVEDQGALAVRDREASVDRGERERDQVREPDPAAGPAGVTAEAGLQGVLAPAGLLDRVDRPPALLVLLPPGVPVVADAAALDLDDRDPGARHRDDQVGLVVTGVVGEPEVRDQHVVRTQRRLHRRPHRPLRRRDEPRLRRDAVHHPPSPRRSG
ncbi:hypothetical protein GCM10009547_35810 [Sporichthya brevicatena]|uniref:Uncharacterized protein n=1 Tax=Sporichthya brevicatena TaxID=171442 RepID=A0ABP3S8L7_9ACTN